MNYIYLKKTRAAIALLFFLLITSSFIDLYELIPDRVIHHILYLQFIPSILKFIQIFSFASIGFVVILLLTFFFGRIYCSTICPLGVLQDIFSFFAKRRKSKKRFFKYRKQNKIVRYFLLIITICSFIFGTSIFINVLDPYSNFGRITGYTVKPIFVWINNGLAYLLQNGKIYTLNIIELSRVPIAIVIYSILFLLLIAYLSYRRGRLFCNLICPVGTFLGMFSKISFLKIEFNNNKCTMCGKCAGVCKAECINVKEKQVDYSQCVSCFNCLTVCGEHALSFSRVHQKDNITGSEFENKSGNNKNRRQAISAILLLLGSSTILSQGRGNGNRHRFHGNKDSGKGLKVSLRKHLVTPPGSQGVEKFNQLCTACGLCISSCPTKVLQPSLTEYGLVGFMQPFMDYAHSGFCNFECNRCGTICPTGALKKLPLEEKKLTQLGKAVFVKHNCVVYTDGNDCGACSEHCPTKAVNMVPYKNGLVIPEVNQDICIGCGACEHPCPVEYPYKAIYVEGNVLHRLADKPKEEKSTQLPIQGDFPF